MQWSSLLGREFLCTSCAQRHHVPIDEVHLVGDDLLDLLPEVARRHAGCRRVVLVADGRTHALIGRAAEQRLAQAGCSPVSVIVPDPGPGQSPVCSDVTRDSLGAVVPACDLLLAVGSGVINDLTKWLAGDRGVPYLAVATAASMNGYSSANIAPTVAGVKTLVRGVCPKAILASVPILASAPAELTAAGFGDVIAKGVSSADWRLNQILFGDVYCGFCVDLVKDVEPCYLEHPESIRSRSPAAVSALFEALVLTGIAMTVAGTSAPASGGEHLISHALDMMSSLDGSRHDLHGRQVGVSTVVCAALYQEVLALESPVFRPPQVAELSGFWRHLAPSIEGYYLKKRARTREALMAFEQKPAKWEEIRAACGQMVPKPEVLKGCLEAAGAAHRLDDIGVSRERYLAALLHAHQIRDRYTVIDLAWAVGVLPRCAEAVVDRWTIA